MKSKLIGFLLVAFLVLLFVGIKLMQSFNHFAQQERTMNFFSPYISEYIDTPFTEKRDVDPYILGKVVTIDMDLKAVDSRTYPKLPEPLRALTPDEVGTVVQIQWTREKIGDYKKADTGEVTGEGFKSKALVSVIDWKNKFKLAEVTFQGADPAKGLPRKGDYESQQPLFQIVEYLKNLPRRQQ